MQKIPLKTVVYVDDDDDIREIALIALQDVGELTVQAFGDAGQLLAALPEPAPDLLLLDVMMPGMDGPALLQALRQLPAYAHVPAIFMTAKVQPTEVSALIKTGAIGVVPKPFDPMQLADSIRDIYEQNT